MYIDKEESFNNTKLLVTEDNSSKLGVLAAKIAYYNFEFRFITLVMFNTVHVVGLQSFLNLYNQSVVLKLGRFVPRHRVNVSQFVIFGENASEIISTLLWLIRAKYDSNAKFVIICTSHNRECNEHKIFQTLVDNYMINVMLLKKSDSSEQLSAYSYRIVLPGKCRNSEPDEIDLISNCYNDKCFLRLFPEKLLNFYKCRLAISTVEQPPFMYLHNGTKAPSGTDGDIMKLVAEMLNATLVVKTPSDGTYMGHYVNNNWTGSLGDIYNGRVHASACTAPLTANKYGNFQISFTYNSMDMVWAAKVPSEMAPWEKLLNPLKPEVRNILLFTFIGIIVTNTLKDTNMWRRMRRTLRFGPPKYNLFFYSWVLFLGMPILKITTKRSFQLIIYTWIWSCFILRCAYQAALINSLKHPVHLSNYKKFEEILKDGHPFGGIGSLRDYYYEDRKVYNNWIIVDLNHLHETFDAILNGTTNFVIASSKEVIKHRIMKYKGSKKLQIIPEKILNSPTVIYFKRYSPLTSPLSYILRIACEAGFVQRLYERYLGYDSDLRGRFETQTPEPLNLHHFGGCFFLLILGWLLSIIYFAVEVICGNLNKE